MEKSVQGASDTPAFVCRWLDLTEEELEERRDNDCYNGVIHGWDPNGHSDVIELEDTTTFCRRPVAERSDCCRAKVGFSEGIHVWELGWSTNRGSCACVGVGTTESALSARHYVPLLGLDNKSWAWNLSTLELQHNGPTGIFYPADRSLLGNDPPVGQPYCTSYLQLRVVLDATNGTLGYELNGIFLGIAFHNLEGRALYPMVSAVFGGTKVKYSYLGEFSTDPLRLRDLCRQVILKSVGKHRALRHIPQLPLSNTMKEFVLLPVR